MSTILMLAAPRLTEKGRIYVGTRRTLYGWQRKVFRSTEEPTKESHPEWDYVIGPFKTVRGAKAAVHFAWFGNPHLQTVREWEEEGKCYAHILRSLPKERSR